MDCGHFANPYAPKLVEKPAPIPGTKSSTNAPLDGRVLRLLELTTANRRIPNAITAVAGAKCPHIQTEFSENFLALNANDC